MLPSPITRLIGALLAVAAAAAVTAAPAAAISGSIAIAVPPNPVRLAPATIGISGTVDAPHRVFVREHAAGVSCPSEAPTNNGDPRLVPVEGVPVGPGPFSIEVQHLMGRSNPAPQSALLCAWLAGGEGWGPVATAGVKVPLRKPVATLAIATPAGGFERGVPATVTVSGSVEAARRLDVVHVGLCENDDSAYGDKKARLTPPAGVTVGPGPFSVSLPWTPEMGSGHRMFCAYLSADGPLLTELMYPETRAHADVVWALPRITVTGPADGAAGELFNPRFSWEGSALRRHPLSSDAVELSRVDGERRVPLLRMTTARWSAQSSQAWTTLRLKGSGATADIAKVEGSSIKLAGGIWPGTYEWRVTRPGHEPSPPRRFTVTAQPLRKFELKTSRELGSGSSWPFSLAFDVVTVPFATYRREWRVAGGRWRTVEWRAGLSARASDGIDTTCRRPGGSIVWRLSVSDVFGTTLKRSGRARNVSNATCTSLKREEAQLRRAEARRQADARRRRAAAERRRREAIRRQQEAEISRYKRNCRAIGGTPVLIEGLWYCRSDSGGAIAVPGFW